MFKKILVAVDGSKYSDAAFDAAVDMAQKYGASLIVVYVFQGSAGRGTLVSGVDEDVNRSAGQKIINSYARKLKDRELPKSSVMLLKGDAARVIIDTAKSKDVGLVVLGSRGQGGFKKLLLGSVSSKVATHAECPVLIVR